LIKIKITRLKTSASPSTGTKRASNEGTCPPKWVPEGMLEFPYSEERNSDMKKRQFSEEQIIKILQEAEQSGQEIRSLSRHHGITEQTFYRWRNKYGGLKVNEAQRLRHLERENARLKKIVADRDLEIDAMKELLAKKW